jgi:hypothetical protein
MARRALAWIVLIMASFAGGLLAQSSNIALNPSRSGFPHPLESDPGWGGGSYPWDLVDGMRVYPDTWAHGLAFCGGLQGWCGQPCGWRQATINFGSPKTFERVLVWHHGDEHIPTTWRVEYWDGTNWVDVGGSATVRWDLRESTSWTAVPTKNIFPPVTGSKVRFSLNNCNITHGWLYEFEVFGSCPGVQGVPLVKQTATAWGHLDYDHCFKLHPAGGFVTCSRTPGNIRQLGCALTSAVMIVNYHAADQGKPFSTTPGLLNDWLASQPDGYVGSVVNWREVARYARDGGVILYHKVLPSGRDDATLRQYLCRGEPVILYVSRQPATSPHHFVVATEEDHTATTTFKINDPFWPDTDLRANYGNTYHSMRAFSRTQTSPGLLVSIDGAPFVITDPAGRRSGFDWKTGTTLTEIPGAFFGPVDVSDEPPPPGEPQQYVFEMLHPLTGRYVVQLFGRPPGANDYLGYFFGYDEEDGPSTAFQSGTLPGGATASFEVRYSPAVGEPIQVRPLPAEDVTPPVLTADVMPSVLWPPNHKLLPVTALVTVADDLDPNPAVTLVSVACDDGCDPAADVVGADIGTDDRAFKLRAERSGTGHGRQYVITYTATDAAGNTATAVVNVVVPHDRADGVH